jgi:AbgT putative transporter family
LRQCVGPRCTCSQIREPAFASGYFSAKHFPPQQRDLIMSNPADMELPKIDRQKGFLGFVERVGNVLPDPVMIFVWLIGILMVLSAIGAALGWSASLPFAGAEAPTGGVLKDGILTYKADSLFSEANLTKIIVDMPKTLTGFAPLGLVLVIMLGASVAERTGMFSALIRASLRDLPRTFMTPVVAVIGMMRLCRLYPFVRTDLCRRRSPSFGRNWGGFCRRVRGICGQCDAWPIGCLAFRFYPRSCSYHRPQLDDEPAGQLVVYLGDCVRVHAHHLVCNR